MTLPLEGVKYSYADYLTWPEEDRWEIIDGIPYLQASPTPLHQEILMELSRQIANYLTDKPCKVYPAPFCVRLSQEEQNENDINNIFEPDISIVCDQFKIDQKGCLGSPDMIIEILSPSSTKRDKITKFNKYEKAGVKEYWLVEPDQKIVSVFLLQDNNRYGRPELYTEEEKITVSIFPDLIIDLSAVFK
jgi:Uma2 family endonuclease